MAGITLFGYRPGTSVLHSADVRMKFFILSLISLCMIKSTPVSGLIYMGFLFIGLKMAGIGMVECLKKLGMFYILLLFVFLARALSTQGEPLIDLFGITITYPGILSGFSVCLKFFLIMITGLVFASTTCLSDIKKAVQWFLRPVPFIPENRVAVMIGLSFGFIPILFNQASQISDARASRCGNEIKNPIKKMVGLAVPLLKKTFLSAEHIAMAMESRAYSDDRSGPVFKVSGNEPAFLIWSIFMAVILIVL